jgi:nucleoside-diphosphate-sugar epimerase
MTLADVARPGDSPAIRSVDDLEDKLSEPSPALVSFFRQLEGDIVILGVGGKMGPTLARQASRAVEASGKPRRLIAVSSFSQPGLRERLEGYKIETLKADLLEPGAVEQLPPVENVIYMVGRKFGSTGAEWNTWATNVLLAGRVAEHYPRSRIVAFSSGNVYPFEPVTGGGSTEATPPGPVGEYAMSCLGRERAFDYWSHKAGTKVLHFRLNYAVELRYGVVTDVALKVWRGEPVDLSMGNFNAVWQGYANEVALRCLGLADSPPRILNVTGPETVSVRWLATRLGELLGKSPVFTGEESPRALLSNAAQCHRLFGYPAYSIDTIAEWAARWVAEGGDLLGKPTHFEARDGKF